MAKDRKIDLVILGLLSHEDLLKEVWALKEVWTHKRGESGNSTLKGLCKRKP